MAGLVVALAVASVAPAPAGAAVAGLPVLPGAVDVERRASETMPSVEYDIREPYPARETIRRLVDAMARAGWRLVEVGGFKPPWPRPGDWPGHAPPGRTLPTHSWRGRWLGENGLEAEFRLTYACPMEASGMHSVWVHVAGVVHGPEKAARRAVRAVAEAIEFVERHRADLRRVPVAVFCVHISSPPQVTIPKALAWLVPPIDRRDRRAIREWASALPPLLAARPHPGEEERPS